MDRLRIPQGTKDSWGRNARLRDYVLAKIKKLYELFGFEPLYTPSIEHAEVFDGHHGEGEKLLFKLTDKKQTEMVLRYDLTVPLARVVCMYPEIQLPYRRYQLASSFRDDEVDKGHFREFMQCDADIVGADSLRYDSDIITMASTGLDMLGFDNHVIRVSHRGLIAALSVYCFGDESKSLMIQRALDHADKITKRGLKGIVDDLVSVGIPAKFAGAIASLISYEGSVTETLRLYRNEFKKIGCASRALDDLDFIMSAVPSLISSRVRIDLSLARGADYYTGFILEGVIPGSGIGAVLGGGRYDNLTRVFSGRNLAATGMAFGLDRILTIFGQHKSFIPRQDIIMLVVYSDDDLDRHCGEICHKLRASGFAVSTNPAVRSPTDATMFASQCHADGIVKIESHSVTEVIPRDERLFEHIEAIRRLCL